jgi:tetratricopeptide (TPR) repeat protein
VAAALSLAIVVAIGALVPGSTARAQQPAPPRPGSAEALWLAARTTARGDSAVALYRRLAERFPRHGLGRAAQVEIADFHYARGDYAAALAEYRRVRGPEASRARFHEALCRYALGETAPARQALRGILRRRNDAWHWSASLLLAQTWDADRRASEALAAYRRLLDLPPGPAQPAALLGAARAAERAEESNEAAKYIERLRARYPNSPEAAEAASMPVVPSGDAVRDPAR